MGNCGILYKRVKENCNCCLCKKLLAKNQYYYLLDGDTVNLIFCKECWKVIDDNAEEIYYRLKTHLESKKDVL